MEKLERDIKELRQKLDMLETENTDRYNTWQTLKDKWENTKREIEFVRQTLNSTSNLYNYYQDKK